MSFVGKKFKRTRCENIDEILKETDATESTIRMLKKHAPTFSFTRENEDTLTIHVQIGDKTKTQAFRLGKEDVVERIDGAKVKVRSSLVSENVLYQRIEQPDGKVSHFRREFGEKDAKMTITLEGSHQIATIYYEVID